MTRPTLGSVLPTFFQDHLKARKGLRPTTIRSYRDSVRLFLLFAAERRGCRLTALRISDLSADLVGQFLHALETERNNHVRSRNQRLTALKCFFDHVAAKVPEAWREAELVQAIPAKRVAPPRTFFLERDEMETLFQGISTSAPLGQRDLTLLLFLYNTGARVQEVADLRIRNLELDRRRVHLHGKGDKWRTCPLWGKTVLQLRELLADGPRAGANEPVFRSQRGNPLTRFGIYKIVRRHTRALSAGKPGSQRPPISPHHFRHTTAVHLLESGVEVNVIRDWLGHARLETTNRYAEITLAMKRKALQACEAPTSVPGTGRARSRWKDDRELLKWLASL
ncbi:MAG: tyrosine-type recombinase/integrase [Bryobacterales bacterium]|nr:tyrosine-type recombinase/integrase [Bryobacterales bacterium]